MVSSAALSFAPCAGLVRAVPPSHGDKLQFPKRPQLLLRYSNSFPHLYATNDGGAENNRYLLRRAPVVAVAVDSDQAMSTGKSGVSSSKGKARKREKNTKRIISPSKSKLDGYQIIKYPLQTESAIRELERNNTLVFVVDIRSDKKSIRTAIEKMCEIQVERVNTLIRLDGTKKAFVKLSPQFRAGDIYNRISSS